MSLRTSFLCVAVLIASVVAAPSLFAQSVSPPASVDTTLYRDLDFRMVGPTRGGA